MSTLSTPISPALWAAFGLLLLAALVAPLLSRRRRAAGIVHLVLTAAAAAVFLVLGAGAVFGRGMAAAQTVPLGPIAVPILLDGLAGLFLVIVSFLAAMSAIYAVRYADRFRPNAAWADFTPPCPCSSWGWPAWSSSTTSRPDSPSPGRSWPSRPFLIRFEKNAASVRAASKFLVLMEAAWLLVIAGGLAAGGSLGNPSGSRPKSPGDGRSRLCHRYDPVRSGLWIPGGRLPLGRIWLPTSGGRSGAGQRLVVRGDVSRSASSACSGCFSAWLRPRPRSIPASGAPPWPRSAS